MPDKFRDGIERRAFPVEIRAAVKDDGGMGEMHGRAAVFNSLSGVITTEDGLKFREQIAPKAFADALRSSDCRALFNHNPDKILGRQSAGTLRLAESDEGLEFTVDPPDTTYARDLNVSMSRGDIKECSFGFTVPKGGDSWARDASGMVVRTINKIAELFDVSPVTYPAYDATSCSLRSLTEFVQGEEAERVAEEAAKIPPFNDTELRRMRLELAEASGGESRVNMGYAGYNTVGVCHMCNEEGCECTGCDNKHKSNMLKAEDGGACTGCMKPNCKCLQCPNTDKVTLKQMYSGYNTVGVCHMCNEEGCECTGCDNKHKSNMLKAEDGGACTGCMKPNCKCLQCPNTDKATLKQMYSL